MKAFRRSVYQPRRLSSIMCGGTREDGRSRTIAKAFPQIAVAVPNGTTRGYCTIPAQSLTDLPTQVYYRGCGGGGRLN